MVCSILTCILGIFLAARFGGKSWQFRNRVRWVCWVWVWLRLAGSFVGGPRRPLKSVGAWERQSVLATVRTGEATGLDQDCSDLPITNSVAQHSRKNANFLAVRDRA